VLVSHDEAYIQILLDEHQNWFYDISDSSHYTVRRSESFATSTYSTARCRQHEQVASFVDRT
jgi:hypothetical protein